MKTLKLRIIVIELLQYMFKSSPINAVSRINAGVAKRCLWLNRVTKQMLKLDCFLSKVCASRHATYITGIFQCIAAQNKKYLMFI